MSRKPEQQMRAWVINELRSLDAVSVENAAYPGTPDVNCTLGWLELKVEKFTSKGILPLKHLEPQQIAWLVRRNHLGGFAMLLVKTDRGWFLFEGGQAPHVQGQTESWCRAQSVAWWKGAPVDLVGCLRDQI